MAAAQTRSATVLDSPILVGTDALSSPVGAAGDRVGSFFLLMFYFCYLLVLCSLLQNFLRHIVIYMHVVAVQT